MPALRTLLSMSGTTLGPAHLSTGTLLLIDAQREYVDGGLPLAGIKSALEVAASVLDRARRAGTPVVHVIHKGQPGEHLFDPQGPFVEIADLVAPREGESVVTKSTPNAFVRTDLQERLQHIGRRELIVVGFMTHMCVTSTVRAANELGYRPTIVAEGCATRDLADAGGAVVPAAMVHAAHLAGLADRFACVVQTANDLLE